MISSFIIVCATVFSLSLWKVYLGAMISNLIGLNYVEMLLLNLSAVFLSAFSTIQLNKSLQNCFSRRKKKKGFDKRLRKILSLWKKYGYWIGAILAPILIGIPTYVIIGSRLKENKRRLFLAMLLSSVFWMSLFYFILAFWNVSAYFNLDNYLTNR